MDIQISPFRECDIDTVFMIQQAAFCQNKHRSCEKKRPRFCLMCFAGISGQGNCTEGIVGN